MATYWHYLIPGPATFRSDAQALANLTDLWLREGWLPAGLKGCAAGVRANCISNLGPDGELPRPEDRVYTRGLQAPYLSSVATPLSKSWFLKNTTDVEVTVHPVAHKYMHGVRSLWWSSVSRVFHHQVPQRPGLSRSEPRA